MPDEKKFPFDLMKAVQDVTNDTAEVRVDVINAGDIGGGTQYADGAARGTGTGTIAMVDDGTNIQTLKGDSSGRAAVNVELVNGEAIDVGAGTEAAAIRVTLPTDGTGKVGLNAGTSNIGDVDVLTIAAGDNNIGNVDIVSGVITTVSTVTAVTALTGGGVADDGTTPGSPVMVGGFSISPDGTDPGSVSAEADVARFRTDLNRRLLVNYRHPRSLHKHLDGTAAYTDEALVADPGDGFQIVITSIIFSSGEAIAINFFLEEGASKIFGPIYIEAVAGRGFVSGPIYLPVTASTAVTLTTSAANDQSFDMDYFIQAV